MLSVNSLLVLLAAVAACFSSAQAAGVPLPREAPRDLADAPPADADNWWGGFGGFGGFGYPFYGGFGYGYPFFGGGFGYPFFWDKKADTADEGTRRRMMEQAFEAHKSQRDLAGGAPADADNWWGGFGGFGGFGYPFYGGFGYPFYGGGFGYPFFWDKEATADENHEHMRRMMQQAFPPSNNTNRGPRNQN